MSVTQRKVIILEYFKSLIRPIYRYTLRLDGAWNSPGYKTFLFPFNYWCALKWNGVPFKQIPAFYTLLQLLKLADEINIKIFACHGTLLGAVRSGSFAGRPKDLDFYITDKDFFVLLANTYTLKKYGFRFGKCKTRKGVVHILASVGVPVSFTIYEALAVKKELKRANDFFVGKEDKMIRFGCNLDQREFDIDWKNDAVGMNISIKNKVTKNIFSCEVLVPDNFLSLIEKQYGKNWHTPIGKQLS